MAYRLYRHLTIRRFQMGPYEFINQELELRSKPGLEGEEAERDIEEQEQAFLKLLHEQPAMDQNQIVQINREAQAMAVQRLGPSAGNTPTQPGGVVRGAASAADLLTAEDRARLQELRSASADSKAVDLNPPKSGVTRQTISSIGGGGGNTNK